MKGKAYFLKWPRRAEDLKSIHLLHREEAYEVIGEVALRAIDYENFEEDLSADRAFLDGYRAPVSAKRYCIFVHQRNRSDGILVVPTDDGHIKYAAYKAATGTP